MYAPSLALLVVSLDLPRSAMERIVPPSRKPSSPVPAGTPLGHYRLHSPSPWQLNTTEPGSDLFATGVPPSLVTRTVPPSSVTESWSTGCWWIAVGWPLGQVTSHTATRSFIQTVFVPPRAGTGADRSAPARGVRRSRVQKAKAALQQSCSSLTPFNHSLWATGFLGWYTPSHIV